MKLGTTSHIHVQIKCIFFFFLGLRLRHMKVLRLGVELELPACTTAMQNPNHICNIHHSSWQRQILNLLSEARDQTCILMDTSQIPFHCTMMGTPREEFLKAKFREEGCRCPLIGW